jgi:peptidoglycan/LPS O-acetylase OafA/YrhL
MLYIALDHIRALAAFMVVVWHFTHTTTGHPVPFGYCPIIFPFALLAEGHTGVALFMTLSGYLFAKLLDGKSIDYKAFLWNRALRLLPLLLVVILIFGVKMYIKGENLVSYAGAIAKGVILPTLPNGQWSITVEFHYYVILPVFLWMLRKSKILLVSIVFAAIALRFILYLEIGDIKSLAYFTIIGRVDQFALGMLVYQFRSYLVRRHQIAIAIICAFTMFYWYFDLHGGLTSFSSSSSPSPLWIVLPTIEGVAYAVGIAWYECSFSHSTGGISRFIGRMGEYSYSIYLLHFLVVMHASRFVNERIMDISNFYLACLWAAIFFVLMMPVGYLSFRFIEAPCLKLRKRYILESSGEKILGHSARPHPQAGL